MSTEMLDAVAVVHERAAQARTIADEAEASQVWPDGLGQRLKILANKVDEFTTIYTPSDAPEERQPVAFDDDLTGNEFEGWVHEKATRMRNGSQRSVSRWAEIADNVVAGTCTWPDHLGKLNDIDSDQCVHRYESFRSALHEAEHMAATIFEMLDGRLTATAPGRGWRLPTRPPSSV